MHRQLWSAALGLVILCSLSFALEHALGSRLEFEVGAVLDGEIWRILTSHLSHTNMPHLLMNLSASVLLFFIFADVLTFKRLLGLYLVAALGISVAYLVGYPQETRYVGLSGILHALAVAGAFWSIKKQPVIAYGLIVAVLAKLIYESMLGASELLAQSIAARVATEAHMFGALSGGIYVLAESVQRKYLRRRSNR